jgi:dTMP kinase
MTGKFFVFEGGEGAGKTTQIDLISKYLGQTYPDLPVVYTREPGFDPAIRQILLDKKSELCDEAELLLYAADRAQHIQKFVRPSLTDGHWVICDRYYASTFAYQCFGRGLDAKSIRQANDIASRGLEPDLWIYLDIEPRTGLDRLAKTRDPDRIERAGDQFFDRVATGYRRFFQTKANKVVIDANQDQMTIHKAIVKTLEVFL